MEELQDLLILTRRTAEVLKESGQTSEDKVKASVDIWARQFHLCVTRDPVLYAGFETTLADVAYMVENKSMARLRNRFSAISQQLETTRITYRADSSFAVVDVQDVILVKQKDFAYPFGISLLELIHNRKELGQGYPRLYEMIDGLRKSGTPTKIAEYYSAIQGKIMTDIRTNLLPALRGREDRIAKSVEITSAFVASFADLITNFVFDLAIMYFNYAVAFTDCTTGTTIQLRAEKVVFSQFATTGLFPLPEPMVNMFRDITRHAIMYGKPR
jgi:hypothetical protein